MAHDWLNSCDVFTFVYITNINRHQGLLPTCYGCSAIWTIPAICNPWFQTDMMKLMNTRWQNHKRISMFEFLQTYGTFVR